MTSRRGQSSSSSAAEVARGKQERQRQRGGGLQQKQEKETKRRGGGGTICDRMAGFLKALGLESKSDYTDKIPETLTDRDFSIHDTFHHGFPSQPSCLAYDPVQKLLAIATRHGRVLLCVDGVYTLGKPGLEGSFSHPETCSVSHLEFIVNKNLLITSCDNRTLYEWSIADKQPHIKHQLQFTKECPTTLGSTYTCDWIFVGTDAGNVHFIHIDSFTLSGYVIHWNSVVEGMQKMRPGDVMAVKEHPMDQGKLLIAYSGSLLVMWNIKNKFCEKRYNYDPGINHVLTSVSWLGSGKIFASTYSDGTVAIWNPKMEHKPEKFYHLHESQAEARISKIIYKLQIQMTESEPWYIFSGGYPEESHNCPKTITIQHGKSLTLLSTNSTIVDFISLPSTPFAVDTQKPLALVILTKEELVVHDLQTKSFPLFSLPHALDLHIPPVSCIEFYGNCPEELIASLHSVKSKMLHKYNSSKPWPVMGGKWGQESPYLPSDLIITGHTDGSIRLWYCSSVIFQPFFTLPTSQFFKFNYTPISFGNHSPSPTKKMGSAATGPPRASPPPSFQVPRSVTPQQSSSELKILPPPRPPPPSSISKAASTSRLNVVDEEETGGGGGGGGNGGGGGTVRHARSSEHVAILGRGSEGSEGGGEGEGEEEEELERLKTPSPATGQLRVEGEEGTDAQNRKEKPSLSPVSSRKTIFSKERKSLFKRPSRSRFTPTDSPRLSPRHQHHPHHLSDNPSEASDERCDSPHSEEKEKEKKKHKKLQSFRKAALKVKIGKRSAPTTPTTTTGKGSSEEREDTDGGGSLAASEGGEEEREEEVEALNGGGGGGGDGDEHSETSEAVDVLRSSPHHRRPDSLRPQSEGDGGGGGGGGLGGKMKAKLKKGSKSFRQDKRILPAETPIKNFVRSFERRTSAPGNFRVAPPPQLTPLLGGQTKILGNNDPSDGPLTPIVEVSPPTVGTDSVFAPEEDVFAVEKIKCCVWGQWLCVSNAGGHVMAFSFQRDEDVTTPKSVEVNFNRDTVLKCGNPTSPSSTNTPPSPGWTLNERATENTPGFRLRQHVHCFIDNVSPSSEAGGGGGGGGSCATCNNLPLLVQTIQYSVNIGLLVVGTNKGLAVIDTESNTVLHTLSSITSLLYMTNPAKFTRQVTRESTHINLQYRPTIHRHSTSWSLSHSSSSSTFHQLNSPLRKPGAASTPGGMGRDGTGRVGGDTSLSLGVADEEYTVVDCESSITALDMVQLRLEKGGPPTLTLWVGTASGHTVTYGIRVKEMIPGGGGGGGGDGRGSFRSKNGKKRIIQLMPTGMILENKHPIVAMQFLNEWGDRQLVPYHLTRNSSIRSDEGRRRGQGMRDSQETTGPTGGTSSNSKKQNYIIIVDERKIKSYMFPGMNVINRVTGPSENTTLLTSQYFLCRDLPCQLTLTSSHHILIHSLPGLKPVLYYHYTPLLNHRIMSTFRVSGDGQALFMSSESEIQRLCICCDDRLNFPGCLPSYHVHVPEPQPASKGKMDWLFGSAPVEMDKSTVFGSGAGQPLMSTAKRDGVSGAGSHQSSHQSTRQPTTKRQKRFSVDARMMTSVAGRGGEGEDERGRGREKPGGGGGGEEKRRTSHEDRAKWTRNSTEEKRQEGKKKEAPGLSGQMNRNREALEQRKQALSELEQKTEQLAGDADDFAALAAKLANKNKSKAR